MLLLCCHEEDIRDTEHCGDGAKLSHPAQFETCCVPTQVRLKDLIDGIFEIYIGCGVYAQCAPLVQGKDFLLDLPDSKTFAKEAADEDFIFDLNGMYEDAKRFFPPLCLILK